MLAYVNGKYIDEDQAVIPVNDRSFRYGDGLFETIRLTNGQPFLWDKHLARLQRGAEFLRIPYPDALEIRNAARHLISQNDCPEGALRIHLSRGPGQRGYSLNNSNQPTLVITTHKGLHPGPTLLRLITSKIRVLAGDPSTQHKTANRLPNILARAEADEAEADEALILNDLGNVAEASAANVFCILHNELLTPSLSDGALAGTTREFVMETAIRLGLHVAEGPVTIENLLKADGVFLTSSHLLVASASSLDAHPLQIQAKPIVDKLRQACEQAQ